MFNIGDKVRVRGDHADSHWVVMMIFYNLNKIGVMHSTKHGTIQRVVDPLDLTLVDSKEDWKQAIREVLLSEEFLAAFAKAFVNAPIPSTIQPAVAWQQPPKEQPQLPDGWRWLDLGEVIRKGDSYWYGARWYDFDCSIGEQLETDMWPSIRRNKFEVGEKVVSIATGVVYEVVARLPGEHYKLRHENSIVTNCPVRHLAPYIEDAK